MVKESQFWFSQFADINVSLAQSWGASYETAATPTTWSTGQAQTYSVSLTNNGTQAWPATGANKASLGVHFANAGGGYDHNTWYSDQRFNLPADLAPGASVTLTIIVTAPSGPTGTLALYYQFVNENHIWFSTLSLHDALPI